MPALVAVTLDFDSLLARALAALFLFLREGPSPRGAPSVPPFSISFF
jgi:hypothetical protein